jgi:hypothetical protein
MRSLYSDPLVPLFLRPGAAPAEPEPFIAPRPRGSRQPHTDGKVATVRRLIEETTLTHRAIAARTGASPASICRWTRDGGWKRPPFAPRASDTLPTARASAHLKRRMLAVRLSALAERHVRELEESACVDPDKLGEALELLKMAKLAAMGRRRRRKTAAASGQPAGDPMRPMAQLCVADVDLRRAPRAAVEDFLAHREPPREDEKPRRRGRSRGHSSDEHHKWMMEREKP